MLKHGNFTTMKGGSISGNTAANDGGKVRLKMQNTKKSVTWRSMNSNIAEVTQNGEVKAKTACE